MLSIQQHDYAFIQDDGVIREVFLLLLQPSMMRAYSRHLPLVGAIEPAVQLAYASAPSDASEEKKRKKRQKQDN